MPTIFLTHTILDYKLNLCLHKQIVFAGNENLFYLRSSKHEKLTFYTTQTMKNLKGSKTEQNLWTAFAGESQARNKYTYFASKAKKEGYVQIAKLFEETANNEKEHANLV